MKPEEKQKYNELASEVSFRVFVFFCMYVCLIYVYTIIAANVTNVLNFTSQPKMMVVRDGSYSVRNLQFRLNSFQILSE